MAAKLSAILFDMDGVLVTSEPLWLESRNPGLCQVWDRFDR